jgi:predicted GIY-YIG superfamily endonuclease
MCTSLSLADARYYIGATDDLRERLKRHNAGEVAHSGLM